MSRGQTFLPWVTATLTITAVVLLVLESRPNAVREERRREFHTLVGGLGFGPAVDPAACEFSFDPRLCPACPNDNGPIPGGLFFCPHHAGTVFDPPPLPADPGP